MARPLRSLICVHLILSNLRNLRWLLCAEIALILVAAKRLSLREAIPAIRRIRDFGRGGVTPSFKRVTTCRKSDDM